MNEMTINRCCAAAKKCAGCQLNNLTYAGQLKYKQRKVNRLFYGLGKPKKIEASPTFVRYRNKATAVFFTTPGKEIRWGIYQSGSRSVCAVETCLLQPQLADAVFTTVAALLKSFKIKPYDPQTKTGFLRSAMVRVSQTGGQAMLVLVTTDGVFPKARSFVNAVVQRHPEITTVVQNIYTGDAVVMTGERNLVLYGSGWIEDTLCGQTFRISPHSFYQINAPQTERLYRAAVQMASLDQTQMFLDAYCGIGTIGLIAAPYAKYGLGVERNAAAVCDARENAKRNGCGNMEFFCGDAGEVLRQHLQPFDVVFLDPPRAGCNTPFLKALLQASPQKIVYISCNPATQVRDVKYLLHHGYTLQTIHPFDLFPQTDHVETVVLMSRVKE